MPRVSDRKRYVKNLWTLWLISATIKGITDPEIVERLVIASASEEQRYIESQIELSLNHSIHLLENTLSGMDQIHACM